MMEKTFNAAKAEPAIRDKWEKAGAFKAGAGAQEGADPYCIVIPPPNVTGSLHMGHALNNTLQDVLVRFERMRGKAVLWQPGMDHAGIATQMVVERQMIERQEPDRRAIGRETFVAKIWKWKDESGGIIVNQLKRLGASCDWSRERFTMDEGLSAAVRKVFVALHKQGLIYRDKRLVNWDPKLRTAISDLEVEQVETNGHLWHFRYPLEGGATYKFPVAHDEAGAATEWEERDYITVATTRPETMLGDTGIAVHPDDGRYKALIGKFAILPLVGRRIEIVADDYADPEAGSGAVKITPAHDFNDFEVGRRHDLPLVNIFDAEANVILQPNLDFTRGVDPNPEIEAAIAELNNLDRIAARKQVVAMMDERGFVEKVEDHLHTVPHGDRGRVPIEPFLTDQWYVDAKTLAAPAIKSVREGRTVFVPKNWEKTYFDWMENIQPWCISRQLWWGHRIPAWYGPAKDEYGFDYVQWRPFVASSQEAALAAASEFYGIPAHVEENEHAAAQFGLDHTEQLNSVPIWQDEDVLDTWFSSALWPFSTLGWPDETPELAKYYPTSVLVTGFDIIFFWVARMMMMGLHFMDEEPFHTVYIHALVRDEQGAKMSKSRGNVIDPLELIDEYGADALRLTLTAMAAQGRDIKLSPARVAGYRNFGTKLWNAARFCDMNECRLDANWQPEGATLAVNRWILTETARATAAVTGAIEAYKFNEAADGLYHFVWDTFCDWHLELVKPVFNGTDEAAKAETRACTAHVLKTIVTLLHPVMPYVTETLWEALHAAAVTASDEPAVLALASWPQAGFADDKAAADINWLIKLVTEIRSVRAEMNVPAAARTNLVASGASDETGARLDRHRGAIGSLARVDAITLADAPPPQSAQMIVGEATMALPLVGVIDFDAEKSRLEREIAKVDGEIARLEKKLTNAKFIERAPDDIVAAERNKQAGYEADKARLVVALERVATAA
ncbi:MAG: valine--tRNA ligase [Alphaproteobacteria bacterium]